MTETLPVPVSEAAPGTVESFVADLGRRFPDLEDRHCFSEMLGVDPKTIVRWWAGVARPVGLNLVKMAYLCQSLGYPVLTLAATPEPLAALAEPLQTMGRALVLRLATPEEIAQDLRCPPDTVYHYVLGKTAPGNGRAETFALWADLYRERVRERWGAWQEQLRRYGVAQPPAPPAPAPTPPEPPAPVSALPGATRQALVTAFAQLARGLLPLAEQLASDDFSPADRDALREQAGAYTIFNLKRMLVKLCGERARDTIP